MPRSKSVLAPLAALALAVALPAAATSSASSAASDSASTSVGSLSTSVEKSSASSSKGKDVAAGEYKVIEVAAAERRPDDLRLTLRAVEGSGAEGEFFLYVPRAALARHGVDAGEVLSARPRPYGVEFALGTPRQAFFLVMDDAWYRELRTTPVAL